MVEQQQQGGEGGPVQMSPIDAILVAAVKASSYRPIADENGHRIAHQSLGMVSCMERVKRLRDDPEFSELIVALEAAFKDDGDDAPVPPLNLEERMNGRPHEPKWPDDALWSKTGENKVELHFCGKKIALVDLSPTGFLWAVFGFDDGCMTENDDGLPSEADAKRAAGLAASRMMADRAKSKSISKADHDTIVGAKDKRIASLEAELKCSESFHAAAVADRNLAQSHADRLARAVVKTICPFCDAEVCTIGIEEDNRAPVTDHINVCPKHPMRELEAQRKFDAHLIDGMTSAVKKVRETLGLTEGDSMIGAVEKLKADNERLTFLLAEAVDIQNKLRVLVAKYTGSKEAAQQQAAKP